MNRLNRRRFLALSSAGAASVVLVACGNDSPSAEDVNPTQIPDVAGAPPTLAPITSTPESGGGESAGGGGESGSGGGSNKVAIEAGDIFFDPTEFTVPAGGTITLNNNGVLQHDFAVDEWGEVVIGPLNGGESGDFTVPDDAKDGDQFTFYCSIPGHRAAGMEGTVTIGAASGGAGEEATAEDESAAGGGGAASFDIEAGDIYFDPTEFSIAPGGTITLNNTGVLQHDFAVDEWGEVVIGPLNGGENGSYTVPDDAKDGDQFTFYCSIPGHRAAGMEGTLTISTGGGGDEAAAAGGTEEEATAEASPEEEEATAVASPAGEVATAGGAESVDVEALDALKFDPSEFSIAPGGTINLTNTGVLEHDFAVDDWGGVVIDVLGPGESGSYTVPDDAKPGDTFDFYCSIPGHKEAGMVGTLTIAEAGGGDEGAAAGGAEEEASPEAATPSGEAASGGGEAGEVTISAFEFGFDPAAVEVAPGATITMTNDGHIEHDIAVDAWGGEVVPLTSGGEQAAGTVPSDAQVGETFDFYCTVAGHKESGMVGKFTIVEGAGGGAAASSPEASPAAEGTGYVLTISSNEWNYSPSEFEAAPGDTIVLRNDGAMAHDMSSEEWGEPFIPDVKHGETGSFVVPDDAEVGSTIEVYSMNQGARKLGMEGKITIVKETKDSFTAPPAPPATPAASPVASPVASSSGGGKTIEVKAVDLAFDPNEFEASPGDTIKLTNEGNLEHDMASETLGVTMIELLSPGESGEFVIPDDASGEVEIHCTVSGHKEAGMVGTITIV